MTTCVPQRCYGCGDELIHYAGRGKDESSSALGQHIHDTYPTTFFWADVDGVIFKARYQLLRIVEHKDPGRPLKRSQKTILPILAIGVDILTRIGWLHEQSGVFAVWAAPPWDGAEVAQVAGDARAFRMSDRRVLDVDCFALFCTGEPLPTPDRLEAAS